MIRLYAVSGALAGLGGIVVGHGQSQLDGQLARPTPSIDVVALTVVGGLTVTLGLAHRCAADRGPPARFHRHGDGRRQAALPWAGCSS